MVGGDWVEAGQIQPKWPKVNNPSAVAIRYPLAAQIRLFEYAVARRHNIGDGTR